MALKLKRLRCELLTKIFKSEFDGLTIFLEDDKIQKNGSNGKTKNLTLQF